MSSTNNYGFATALEDDLPGVWGLLINQNYKRYEDAIGGFSVITLSSPPGDSTYNSVSQTLTWVTDFNANSGDIGGEYRSKVIRFDPGTETISSSPVLVVPTNTSGETDRDAQMVFIVENNTGTEIRVDPKGTFSSFASIPLGKSGIVALSDSTGSGGSAEDLLKNMSASNMFVSTLSPSDDIVSTEDATNLGLGQGEIVIPPSQSESMSITVDPFSGSDNILLIDRVSVEMTSNASLEADGDFRVGIDLTVDSDSSVKDVSVDGNLTFTGTLTAPENLDFQVDTMVPVLEHTTILSPNPPGSTETVPASSYPGGENVNTIPGAQNLATFSIQTTGRSGNSRVLFFSSSTGSMSLAFLGSRGSQIVFYSQVASIKTIDPPVFTFGELNRISVSQQKPAEWFSGALNSFSGGPILSAPIFDFGYIDDLPATTLLPGHLSTFTNIMMFCFLNPLAVPFFSVPFGNCLFPSSDYGVIAIDFGVLPS